MAKTHSTPANRISKTQRRYQVGYVSIRHESRRDITATYYSLSSSLPLRGDWLREAKFETGCPVTVRINEGRLILTVDTQAGG